MRIAVDENELYTFWLLALACHEPPYRLAWALEKKTGLAFAKTQNLELPSKAASKFTMLDFAQFVYKDEDGYRNFHLLANRADNEQLLLPELKGFDYLLIVKGNLDEAYFAQLRKQISQINFIILQQKINVKTLKNRKYILF